MEFRSQGGKAWSRVLTCQKEVTLTLAALPQDPR